MSRSSKSYILRNKLINFLMHLNSFIDFLIRKLLLLFHHTYSNKDKKLSFFLTHRNKSAKKSKYQLQ